MMEQIELTHRISIESWTEGREKKYRARTPVQRPNAVLSVEDIQHLLLCRDIVWHWLPESLRANIEASITKTAVLLPRYDGRSEALTSLAGARSKGVVDYSRSQGQIESIMQALRERRICEVAYLAPERDSAKILTLAPYQILAYREGLYVRCRMEKALSDPEKFYDPTLALHRIQTVTLTDRAFSPIVVKAIEDAGPSFGLIWGDPVRVTVAISPKAAMYVRERTWSADQEIVEEAGGGLKLSFTSNSRVEIVNWVLSFGGEATLCAPHDLRTEILERVEAMRKAHLA
jgi:predicted DNA-binding transcriptional regulator YafY